MDLNLSPDEIKFPDELTWLAANAPTDWDERREESMDYTLNISSAGKENSMRAAWRESHGPKNTAAAARA